MANSKRNSNGGGNANANGQPQLVIDPPNWQAPEVVYSDGQTFEDDPLGRVDIMLDRLGERCVELQGDPVLTAIYQLIKPQVRQVIGERIGPLKIPVEVMRRVGRSNRGGHGGNAGGE